jgi:Holliday junction resolvasome RuvABC endonuclease subunit
MVILCLDLGTETGWCIYDSNGQIPVIHGCANLSFKKREGEGMRYIKFYRFLYNICKNQKVEKVFFEDVKRHLGTAPAHVFGGFRAVLQAYCDLHKIKYEGIGVKTIKKAVTGTGNANKDDMIKSVIEKGYIPDCDDEADAIGLMLTIKSLNMD